MQFVSIVVGFVLLSGHGPVGSTESLNGIGNNVQAIRLEHRYSRAGIDKEVFLEKRLYQEGATNG